MLVNTACGILGHLGQSAIPMLHNTSTVHAAPMRRKSNRIRAINEIRSQHSGILRPHVMTPFLQLHFPLVRRMPIRSTHCLMNNASPNTRGRPPATQYPRHAVGSSTH